MFELLWLLLLLGVAERLRGLLLLLLLLPLSMA